MSDATSDDTATGMPGAGSASRLWASWRVVVPVKGGPAAKSRLRVPDGVDRLDLATALALDTVAAAAAAVGAAHVTVVTSDARVVVGVGRLGPATLDDPGLGLNAAVAAGLRGLRGVVPGEPVAVLLGDVPALRPAELTVALVAAQAYPAAFVPDAEGTGTVLLAMAAGDLVTPRFGVGSAAAHEADGAVRLAPHLPGLRRDVDDEASLREALLLGVGRHTAALLAHLITPSSGAPRLG
ncbi:MAG: 2-phospho-L-lactate guanylyltransferase [Lapillicoccus sp.]